MLIPRTGIIISSACFHRWKTHKLIWYKKLNMLNLLLLLFGQFGLSQSDKDFDSPIHSTLKEASKDVGI